MQTEPVEFKHSPLATREFGCQTDLGGLRNQIGVIGNLDNQMVTAVTGDTPPPLPPNTTTTTTTTSNQASVFKQMQPQKPLTIGQMKEKLLVWTSRNGPLQGIPDISFLNEDGIRSIYAQVLGGVTTAKTAS